MCNGMNVLQQGRHGYVAACCGCGHFQVAFGTTLMHLEKGEVHRLVDDLRVDLCSARCAGCPLGKAYVYDVGAINMRLILDHREVALLDDMLAEALWIHGIYAGMTEGGA